MGYTLDMVKRDASSLSAGLLGWLRGAARLLVGTALCSAAGSAAWGQSPAPNRTAIVRSPNVASYLEKREQLDRVRRQAELKNELLEKRRLSGRLSSMGIFQPKDGGAAVLTNRLSKYRKRGDYSEIKIEFDPIVIPNRYRIPGVQYTDSQIHELVSLYARQYALDESLVHAMIDVESRGNPRAVSSKGASGLMQLMPGTADEMGVRNIFDPAENIAGGTQYIAKLLNLFEGNVSFALAGYNAGPENVKQYGGIPPFAETQSYVRRVLEKWLKYRGNGNLVDYPVPEWQAAKKVAANQKPAPILSAALKSETEPKQHQVLFKSGNVQKADKVVQSGEYYFLEVGGRTYQIQKDQIESIDGDDEPKLAAKL